MTGFDLSVVISTRNRGASLRATLSSLISADRPGIRAEIVVVDNGGSDDTEAVVASFAPDVPIRYLRENAIGKCHALNKGVAAASGAILAVLDDDMTVDREWLRAVVDICGRYPDADVFGGSIRVVFPSGDIPEWAKQRMIFSEIFSANEFDSEGPLSAGMWFSGNHFWFRSRALSRGVRFADTWVTEGKFQLDLIDRGAAAVSCPAAVAHHHIQRDLLSPDVVIARARRAGVAFARVRLQPYRPHVRSARMLHEHPILTRLFLYARYLRGVAWHGFSVRHPDSSPAFASRVVALNRITLNREYLRIANQCAEYSVRRSVRVRALPV